MMNGILEIRRYVFSLSGAVFAVMGIGCSAFAMENVDVGNEISRIKKELSQARVERQKVAEDISKDAREFADYERRAATRKSGCIAETDSIKRQTALTVKKSDSLAAVISGLQLKRKQYELMQEAFRQSVMAACARIQAFAKTTPDAASNQSIGPLTFLMNDCSSKAIDNVEAVRRLMQIIQNLDEASAAIRVGQETAAVPEIRGAGSMLRIGDIFEAVTDDDGKVCAFWRGPDAFGQGRWGVVHDPAVAAVVLKAINVRQGKALPSFVDLPYNVSSVKEAKK